MTENDANVRLCFLALISMELFTFMRNVFLFT